MTSFIIVDEVETKDGIIQVRKIYNDYCNFGFLFNDFFTVKHLNVGADGAIIAIAHYLQNRRYIIEQY